jgi:hypothetical protein
VRKGVAIGFLADGSCGRTQDCGPAHLEQVITVLCDDRTAPSSIHAQVEALIGFHVENAIREKVKLRRPSMRVELTTHRCRDTRGCGAA